ncbi:MAG TPA: helix-turn-helix domain-containing GNAT family N-acetyltransferase [Terriglobales bacterium]|nr:helix-turn-helix domain-containing GNAT family N-acetyltransferase [Terriglobales bacterium]
MPAAVRDRIDAVRRFNRFYTAKIGVLHEPYKAPFSLTETRVLFELAHCDNATAGQLGRELGLDPGYLSRILQSFENKRLLARAASKDDARQQLLKLTVRGRKIFDRLNNRTAQEIGALLGQVSLADQDRAVRAMSTIEEVFGASTQPRVPYILRPHRPGDMGWIIHRHGVLYSQEYGWDERFEALVAIVAGEFIQNFDRKRERCWIAEREGEIVGSVFLVKKSTTVAKLRLLYVEPKARGLGIGLRLVEECIRFAREARYRKITLWTQSNLAAARHIYRKCGFDIVESKPQPLFGHDLVSETWEMKL